MPTFQETFPDNDNDTEDIIDIDWDKFTNDDELYWDNIFGKNFEAVN